MWIEMNPDLAIGEVKKPYKAGVIGVKFSIHDVTSKGEIDWKQSPAWAGKLHRRPPNMKVRVYCWQARDLPAADESGSSDPFIKIFNTGDEEVQTVVIEDNVNPIFMSCKEVGLDFMDF